MYEYVYMYGCVESSPPVEPVGPVGMFYMLSVYTYINTNLLKVLTGLIYVYSYIYICI
jgi:hypothetical protein